MSAKPPTLIPRPEDPPEKMWASGRALEWVGRKYLDLVTVREGQARQRRAQELRHQQGLPPFETR